MNNMTLTPLIMPAQKPINKLMSNKPDYDAVLAEMVAMESVIDWHFPTQNLIEPTSVCHFDCNNIDNVNEEGDGQTDVLLADPELKEPSLYAVVMFNDDYTPMDFVVLVLMSEFKHTEEDAIQIMLSIHNNGKGVAGIYSKDIAETKASKVNALARREGFPLMTQIEPNKG